ncbi:MAG: phytanoyl-CoA dioxygenase family protein [Alphaproteobacteria bacterium]|nr:phytanoyl-CoA dioxygenase family protein [Alphaproteobacteria bacterium]MCB9931302.1 phytanoyl-CoA dioxygenase family protein [Alphaproteobacteria bacterium]
MPPKPNLPLLDLPPVDYGDQEDAMRQYRAEGTARALAMDNRGPFKFTADGKLDPAILEAYDREGFYVFENFVGADELAELERDLAGLLDRAPVGKDETLDKHGNPAFCANQTSRSISWVRPLSDPLGGTDASYGRHPSKMYEPKAGAEAPEWVLQLIHGSLMHSEAALRLYGHPHLLKFAEAVNGADFTPFNEAIWIKQPRLGGSVAWHQDGWTHWNSPDLDGDTHGFNTMMQLYGCDAANGLWVVPGSHKGGKKDIKAMVAAAGSDRLPEAVPLICGPGDLAVTNRQAIHGSFANTSQNIRVTYNMGFHRRKSVLGVKSGGVHNPVSEYTPEYIRNRSRLIMLAIDARRQRHPGEESYVYTPLAAEADRYRWSPDKKAEIWDYNLQDIGI